MRKLVGDLDCRDRDRLRRDVGMAADAAHGAVPRPSEPRSNRSIRSKRSLAEAGVAVPRGRYWVAVRADAGAVRARRLVHQKIRAAEILAALFPFG